MNITSYSAVWADPEDRIQQLSYHKHPGNRQLPLTGECNPWVGLAYPARGIDGESVFTEGSHICQGVGPAVRAAYDPPRFRIASGIEGLGIDLW